MIYPYIHSIFTLLLIKQVFEKNKSSRAASESRTQFWPRITSACTMFPMISKFHFFHDEIHIFCNLLISWKWSIPFIISSMKCAQLSVSSSSYFQKWNLKLGHNFFQFINSYSKLGLWGLHLRLYFQALLVPQRDKNGNFWMLL